MGAASEVRYARASDGVYLAYRVIGDGSPDVLFLPASFSNVGVMTEHPPLSRFLGRLGALGRLVFFDKRGTGLSDPVPTRSIPSLEEWMDDVSAVLDEVGAGPTHFVGMESGGPMGLLYAATHPQRVASLSLLNSFARLGRSDDYPIGIPAQVQERILAQQIENYSGPLWWEALGDSGPTHPGATWWTRFLQYSVGPGAGVETLRATFGVDVRHILPSVRTRSLVLHRRDNPYIRLAHGRWLHEHLPGSTFVELDGAAHLPWEGDADAVLAEIEYFIAGERRPPEADRVLATVLFTDIVASTELASSLGDQRWRELLDAHDSVSQRLVGLARGRVVKQTGDGILATFDGPARAIGCALRIAEEARALGVPVRAGLHTGEIERRGDDLSGIAVHIGARVAAAAGPGEVLVSSAVPPLVTGSGLRFADRGEHDLKGVPGTWRLYGVVPGTAVP